MKIKDNNITVDTVAILPWWICALLFIAVFIIMGIGIVWRLDLIDDFVLIGIVIFLLALIIVVGIIAEKHIEFAKQVYGEYLKLQKAKTDGETQNSKLSETLLKLWTHHEDCKGKSLQISMDISSTELSC